MSSSRDYKSRINATPNRTGSQRLKMAIAIAFGIAATVTLISLFSTDDSPEEPIAREATTPTATATTSKRITRKLSLPNQQGAKKEASTDAAAADTIEPQSQLTTPQSLPTNLTELSHTVKSGENLSVIFSKLELSKKELYTITHSGDTSKALRALRPGKKLSIYIDTSNRIERLVYEKNRIDSIIATRTEQGFDVAAKSKEIVRHQVFAKASIQSSLFNDAKKAGISDKTIMELANIFGWDIDFALDLRENDQFSILYEKQFVDGEEISAGNILAAEFSNRGKTFRAVRFVDPKGHSNYFTPEGDSMRKTFLRTPVDFARISSRFNLKRKHPVLNRIRAHKGVDYAASTGTPIKSTGDGRIIFRGRKGGYGRVVIVQHGQRYTTLYAHLSKFHSKRRSGSYVKQGQTIGYVGMSGLASGPHLHYEFRVNGVHRNPLTVSLPHAKPISRKYLAAFKQQTQPLISQLDQIKTVRLAQSSVSSPLN